MVGVVVVDAAAARLFAAPPTRENIEDVKLVVTPVEDGENIKDVMRKHSSCQVMILMQIFMVSCENIDDMLSILRLWHRFVIFVATFCVHICDHVLC